MGQIIEEMAVTKGHEIVAKFDSKNPFLSDSDIFSADVAIEFSQPDLAPGHILNCINRKLPIVVGTTGWYQHLNNIVSHCNNEKSAIFAATNFSLGVNLFFQMAKKMTALLNNHGYNISINEIHHTEKKDAPSGTAITLAENVILASQTCENWKHLQLGEINQSKSTIPITAERIAGVPGTHILTFQNEIDSLSLTHNAKSREGFAAGAILAAEWILGKSGVYGMNDLLNFENL